MLKRLGLRAIAACTVCLSLILAAFIAIGSGKSSDDQDPPKFPQPKVDRSSHGVLLTTLHTFIAHNRIQDAATGETRDVLTPAYNGTIPGPTLRVKPGDTMNILLVNGLPENPDQDRTGAFPHDPYTTNIHTHGLTVSPRGNSDNVLREMAPKTKNVVQVKIPQGHQSGTF